MDAPFGRLTHWDDSTSPPPDLRLVFPELWTRGDTAAILTRGGSVTYAQLARLVDERGSVLGPTRRLVLVEATNELDSVVSYLAALTHGHVALLVPGATDVAPLLAAYRPDVVLRREHGWQPEETGPGTAHEMHPDLALLLSTSGSTGSPKLVRLSHTNLRSNAASIAEYLRLTPSDCAATTLPIHYCYGLSVLNSHLLVGARLLLETGSVLDEGLWSRFAAAGATSFAGVPYTFDLLDSSGFESRELPSLRLVTQAGGRMRPERVRHYAELGRERGFDFVVMYGATEATARMAYLPPALAESRPSCIGIPIPGGSFRLAEPDHAGVGELVYRGPNVMLGYASTAADLRKGREIQELRTGDLARRHADGLYEVVGRSNRVAKVFGLRLDLDHVEHVLEDAGVSSRVVMSGGRVAVFVRDHRARRSATAVLQRIGIPPHSFDTHVIADFPRTASGKTDTVALTRHADLLRAGSSPAAGTDLVAPAAVRDLLAELLGRPEATEDDSFATLRGDSLSFVEVSIRLGELLGRLPQDWPSMTARELALHAHPRKTRVRAGTSRHRADTPVRAVEAPVLLRAVAIVLVVASHANLIAVLGGAHLLLGVAGFNLARFHLVDLPARRRAAHLLRAARQVFVPAVLWIGAVALVAGTYEVPTAVMLNHALGADTWNTQWHFWYLEVVVWALVGMALLVVLPGVHTAERRWPLAFASVVLAITLTVRYVEVGIAADQNERYTLALVLWCVAMGWVIARCHSTPQRLALSLVLPLSVFGFFDDPVREGVVVAGLLALVWLPPLALPRWVATVVSALAGASLFIYLTHWQVYPWLEDDYPVLATLSSLLVGLVVWRGYLRVARSGSGWASRVRGRLRPPGPPPRVRTSVA